MDFLWLLAAGMLGGCLGLLATSLVSIGTITKLVEQRDIARAERDATELLIPRRDAKGRYTKAR